MVDILMSRSKVARTPDGAAFLSNTNLFFSGCFVPILVSSFCGGWFRGPRDETLRTSLGNLPNYHHLHRRAQPVSNRRGPRQRHPEQRRDRSSAELSFRAGYLHRVYRNEVCVSHRVLYMIYNWLFAAVYLKIHLATLQVVLVRL